MPALRHRDGAALGSEAEFDDALGGGDSLLGVTGGDCAER
jgi:hypothetical protein